MSHQNQEFLLHKRKEMQTLDVKENLVRQYKWTESIIITKTLRLQESVCLTKSTRPQICEPAVILSFSMKAVFTDPYPFEGDSSSRTQRTHTALSLQQCP